MAELSKTARAAAAAVAKSEKKAKAEVTPAEAIRLIRIERSAKLFVVNMYLIDLLLAEYDTALTALAESRLQIIKMKMQSDSIPDQMFEADPSIPIENLE